MIDIAVIVYELIRYMNKLLTVVVLLLVCRYSSAQGGCTPTPPNTLISGGPFGALRNNNVPNIITSGGVPNTLFRPVVGPHTMDPWAVFSKTQVRQHGLWCQVQQSNTNNMADNNIGDWYYPTPSGFAGLNNVASDGTPYQELKCDNQVGLVVDGDIMNNQGIVRCTTSITGLTTHSGLSTDTNYLGVYVGSVITTIRNCELLCMIINLMNGGCTCLHGHYVYMWFTSTKTKTDCLQLLSFKSSCHHMCGASVL